jgi:hypothetical protein
MMSFLPGVDELAPFLRFELLKLDNPFSRFLFTMIARVWSRSRVSVFWSDVAERSVVVLLVRMVCLQRFLTQSLICEPEQRHHRIMLTPPCKPRMSPM